MNERISIIPGSKSDLQGNSPDTKKSDSQGNASNTKSSNGQITTVFVSSDSIDSMIKIKPSLSNLLTRISETYPISSDYKQYIDSFSIDWSAVEHDLDAAKTANGVEFETLWTIILKHVTITGSDSKKEEALKLLNENVIASIKKHTPSTGI